MKKSDIKVLTYLRRSGRMPLTTLAKKSGLPVSTLHERLRQKVREGVFKPALLLDFAKLGFTSVAFIKIAVDLSEKDALMGFLRISPNVNSLFRINNGWHALAEVVFEDMHQMEDFLERLEGKFHVRQKEVVYVLDEVNRECFLADEVQAQQLLARSKV